MIVGNQSTGRPSNVEIYYSTFSTDGHPLGYVKSEMDLLVLGGEQAVGGEQAEASKAHARQMELETPAQLLEPMPRRDHLAQSPEFSSSTSAHSEEGLSNVAVARTLDMDAALTEFHDSNEEIIGKTVKWKVPSKTTNKQVSKGPKTASKRNKAQVTHGGQKEKYKNNMNREVDIPLWSTVREILLANGYVFGMFEGRATFARPFGDPTMFPSSVLGQDYFVDFASFRAHVCAEGMDYVDRKPQPQDLMLVNKWCRYSIASEFAKPAGHHFDFRLKNIEMKEEVAHHLLCKLGFQRKVVRGNIERYQWPEETKPHQLMDERDMWIRLAKFWLPVGGPLEMHSQKKRVLALLLFVAEKDLKTREIPL